MDWRSQSERPCADAAVSTWRRSSIDVAAQQGGGGSTGDQAAMGSAVCQAIAV